jgi:hypothetical protein
MCHPQKIRSRTLKGHDGGNTLTYQDNRAGLRTLPLNPMECEIFYRRLLPSRMLIPVTDSYLSREDRTDWGLLNACTLHAKHLPPGPNMRAHARLGRYFGLGKASPYVC